MIKVTLVLALLALALAQITEIQVGRTYLIHVPNETSPDNLGVFVNRGTPVGTALKFLVSRFGRTGQEIALVRNGAAPTKSDYDESDTALLGEHVIQFTSTANDIYVGVLNIAPTTATYNIGLELLPDPNVLDWDEPFGTQVCHGFEFPMYGPPSLSLGLKSYAVSCAQRGQQGRGITEFRKYNGRLLNSFEALPPRGTLFQEPALLYVKGLFLSASSYVEPGFPDAIDYDFVNVRSYDESDGSLLTNATWGIKEKPVARSEFPQLLWDGENVSIYWHEQTHDQTSLWTQDYTLQMTPKDMIHAIWGYQPVTRLDNGFPSRVRAVINPVLSTPTNFVTALFVYNGDPRFKQLSLFTTTTSYKNVTEILIPGQTLINNTDGGLDLQVLNTGDYVTVFPSLPYGNLQLDLISAGSRSVTKTIMIKHNCLQPNLVVINKYIFLITTNEGVGFVTVLSNTLDIISSTPIGGQRDQTTMFSPVMKYDPMLDLAYILYSLQDGTTVVRNVTITFP